MKFYNTLTRQKEEFIPINSKKATIYACGPTVYNYIHIGNARPICVFDVLRRFLEYTGYNVHFVQNFTDIDDKIIKRAIEENISCTEVSEKYIKEYEKDASGLNVMKATVHPKASECVPEIISMISELIKKEYAYKVPTGDVYFRARKFSEYGKLSKQTIDALKSGARVEIGEIKEDPLDFALWKAAKPGEPSWTSPWGEGRPGWHIECSVMAKKYLGDSIDMHCGGQDLIFPHHENEIAQSECSNGVKFANYWIHNGYINVDDKKMSKSLNNFFTVREISERYGYEPIRYLMISSHYRSPVNYSEEIMTQCISSLDRLYKFRGNLNFIIKNSYSGGCSDDIISTSEKCPVFHDFLPTGGKEKPREQFTFLKSSSYMHNDNILAEFKNKFIKCMEDDLNTSDALSVIFDMVKKYNIILNRQEDICFSKEDLLSILKLFDELCKILGILYARKSKIDDNEEIISLINKREEARKNGNWDIADKIREDLKNRNIILEDTPNGVKWSVNN
ncbi:MAG: cysteine--tRNA ligase [Oscillospiraceae bacterium]|nr:cysteine--tRNA ligase [Oscillospiraceae bacterium]